jgi:hypothetical protein
MADRAWPLRPNLAWRPALTEVGDFLALVGFGIACAFGLAGAFVGLESHGFWFDELLTAHIVEPSDPAEMLARIAEDVHPPLYSMVLFAYAKLVGISEPGLRSFSALSACAAVLLFVAATRQAFTLAGRLFGAAMATGSLFWFFQSQNARPYALSLLVSVAILAICLRLLSERRDLAESKTSLLGLTAFVFVGSFVHFYVLYESLAVLIVLAFLRPDKRLAILGIGVALLASVGLYITLVAMAFSQANLASNWIRNDVDWYRQVLESCLQYALGKVGSIAIVICAVVFAFHRALSREDGRDKPRGRFPLDPVMGLLLGVPLLVLAGSVVSSTLFTPNFFDRSFLVLSPFLWAFCARLYDQAAAVAPPAVRVTLALTLSGIVLSMASIVLQRLPPERPGLGYEPFRESAEWIRGIADCRSEIVPVISTDRREWYKPGRGQAVYASTYGYYLQGFARPQVVFVEDALAGNLSADLRAELGRRLDGKGCPIVAWAVHNMPFETMTRTVNALLRVADPAAAGAVVKAEAFADGQVGYVMYLDR